MNSFNWSFVHPFLKGEFYSKQNHSEPPFKLQPFTLPVQPGYMLSLGVSEFTLNSASYGYYSAGLLKVLITNSMVSPPESATAKAQGVGTVTVKFVSQSIRFAHFSLTIVHFFSTLNVWLTLRNVVFDLDPSLCPCASQHQCDGAVYSSGEVVLCMCVSVCALTTLTVLSLFSFF